MALQQAYQPQHTHFEDIALKRLKLYLMMLALVALAACGRDDTSPIADAPSAGVTEANVSVENFQYARLPGGGRIITGKLLNPTPETIRNAQIQISLFDKDNLFISNMTVTIQDLKPGSEKSFRQPVDGDDTIHGARVRGVLVM